MIRKNGKLIEVAACDWKSPDDMVAELVQKLPSFGIHAVEVRTGVDGCAIAFSGSPITEDEALAAFDNRGFNDWDLDKDEALAKEKEGVDKGHGV